MAVRFRVLTRTGLLIGDQFNDQWGRPKIRGLLAVLLLTPNQPVAQDKLAEWLWPESAAPRDLAGAVQNLVHQVRHFLGQMADPPRLPVERGQGAYWIEVAKSQIDYFEYRRIVTAAGQLGRDGNHQAARDLLVAAVNMWSAEPLADLHGDRANDWRRWADTELLIPAQGSLMGELIALGEFDEVLTRCTELPVEHNTHLVLVKRRLEALIGLHRGREAAEYNIVMHRKLRADGDDAAADELARFYGELVRGRVPEVKTRVPPARNLLPRKVPDFFDRNDLVQHLDEVVATRTTPTIVLEGAAGVGKSALAVHWAHQAAERFPGGLHYVDLVGFSANRAVEPGVAVDKLLTQLGVAYDSETTADARATVLRGLLSGRDALVLVDNAMSTEHVQPLMNCLPCTVVITSRRRLSGLSRMGAITVPVPPLGDSPSREWLSSQIGGRGLAEPGALGELAELADGNLLLLRRVADHVRSTPGARLAEFVDELRHDDALLDLGLDDDDPDGSVGAAFSWSYLGLDDDTKRAFRLLSNHPGQDVSVAAAAALIGVDRLSAARQLDGLVKENMLAQPEQRTRYRLASLLRKYAVRCGASEHWRDESRAAQERMMSYYHHAAHRADRISFPNRAGSAVEPLVADVTPPTFDNATVAREWLVRERLNLTSVIGFARTHGYHKYVTAMSGATGETFLRLGYYRDVLFGLRAAIASAEAIGDVELLADSLGNLGFVLLRLRDYSAAEDYFRRSKEMYDRIGLPIGIATSLNRMGRLFVERNDYPRGIETLQAAVRALRAIDLPMARGHEVVALYRLGEAFRRARDLDAAIRHANQGLWLAETSSDVRGSAYCHAELAATCYELRDLQLAHSHSVRSSELSRDLQDYELAAKNWRILGLISRDQGDIQRAQYYLQAAAAAARESRDLFGEAEMYHLLGQLLHDAGDTDKAVEWLTKAMTIFEHVNDSRAENIRRLLD